MSSGTNIEAAHRAFEQIAKYATASNAAALTLSLGFLGNEDVVKSIGVFGKISIFIFAIGLIFSGLHQITYYYFKLTAAAVDLEAKICSLRGEAEALAMELLQVGRLNRMPSLQRLNEVPEEHIDEIKSCASLDSLNFLRGAQEFFLWSSYILFCAGLMISIYGFIFINV